MSQVNKKSSWQPVTATIKPKNVFKKTGTNECKASGMIFQRRKIICHTVPENDSPYCSLHARIYDVKNKMTQTDKIVEPTKMTKPIKPVESAKCVESTKITKSTKVAKPVKCTEPTKNTSDRVVTEKNIIIDAKDVSKIMWTRAAGSSDDYNIDFESMTKEYGTKCVKKYFREMLDDDVGSFYMNLKSQSSNIDLFLSK